MMMHGRGIESVRARCVLKDYRALPGEGRTTTNPDLLPLKKEHMREGGGRVNE